MKYIRTKDGIIDTSYFCSIIEPNDVNVTQANGRSVLILGKDVIKGADTIRELIMKGDLIFYKDSYSGLNATEYPSIAYNDIDKCNQYFEKEITKIFIEDTNGNFIKVAELDDRHNLKIV